jgi:hypothetical protein
MIASLLHIMHFLQYTSSESLWILWCWHSTSLTINTLQYLKHALFWINKLKNVFQHLHSVNLNINKEHFNILKLHVMIHYAQYIHQYDNANNVDTEYSEIVYKFLVKIFSVKQTNTKAFNNSCCFTTLIIWT